MIVRKWPQWFRVPTCFACSAVANQFNRQAGLEEIPAEIHQGGRRDAILCSVGANAAHGLRRTNADKRRAVQALLKDEEWSQWSDNAIAKAAKVSPHTVKVAREHFANAKCDVRKTTDGRAMNTSNIGRKAKGPKTDAAEDTPDTPDSGTVHPREEPTEASEHRTVVTRAEYESAQSPATEPAVDRTPKAAPDVLSGLSDEQLSRLCEAALELRMALQADRPVDIPADLQEASLRVCRIVLDEPEEEAGD